MVTQNRTTFAKRQKEQARQEKQRAKAQRKLERKLQNQQATEGTETAERMDETTPSPDQNESLTPPMDSH